jgi:hypothetical protein
VETRQEESIMTMTPDPTRGPHILLRGGLWFPYSPRVEDVRFEHFEALSRVPRYGGHFGAYSVAEHSVRVAWALRDNGFDDETVLAGLIHDAHEAYPPGDVPSPVKWPARGWTVDGELRADWQSLADGFVVLEAAGRKCVREFFGFAGGLFATPVKRAVDVADMVLLATEARDLCGYERGNPEHDAIWGGLPEPLVGHLGDRPWSADEAITVWQCELERLWPGAKVAA